MGIDCNQSKRSDQQDKCSKNWFREVCSKSCCAIGFPPVVKYPKCEVLTEPTKVENLIAVVKRLTVINQNDRISKINVRRIGLEKYVQSHAVLLDFSRYRRIKCEVLTEPLNIKRPDSSDKKIDCNQSERSD